MLHAAPVGKEVRASVLAYSYDNGFLHEGARKNIDLVTSRLGIEHRYVARNPELMTRMVRGLMKNNCADLCMICMNGVASALNRLAEEEDIPVLAWGNSPMEHSVIPLEMINFLDFRFMVDAVKPHVDKSELGDFKHVDLPQVISMTYLKRRANVFVPEYCAWNDQENVKLLEREYGWVDYGKGTPHFDCVINRAVNYFMNRRLGASKVEEMVSQKVRRGRITRDEGLRLLDEEDDKEEPVDSVEELCRRLGMSREELQPLLDGTALDFRHFKGYAHMFRRLSWLLWLSHKLGFTPGGLYQKYS